MPFLAAETVEAVVQRDEVKGHTMRQMTCVTRRVACISKRNLCFICFLDGDLVYSATAESVASQGQAGCYQSQ